MPVKNFSLPFFFLRKQNKKLPTEKKPHPLKKRIAILMPNWLGDGVMALSFVKNCHQIFPESELDLILSEKLAEIPTPAYTHKIIRPKKRWEKNFIQKLRKKKYDLLFLLPNSFSAAFFGFLIRAKKTVGYNTEARGFLLHYALRYVVPHRSQHIIAEWNHLFSPFFKKNLPAEPPKIDWQADEFQAKKWIDFGFSKSMILFAPFSAYGPAKNWPLDFFQQLSLSLFEKGHPVGWLGLSQDYKEVEKIKKKQDLNFCGKTTLLDLCYLLQNTPLLVANDSGIRQMASALGVKNIGIFGSSNPKWTGPLDKMSQIFYTQEPCSPCYQKTCKFGHYHCLSNISPLAVAKQALLHLKKE